MEIKGNRHSWNYDRRVFSGEITGHGGIGSGAKRPRYPCTIPGQFAKKAFVRGARRKREENLGLNVRLGKGGGKRYRRLRNREKMRWNVDADR